MQNFGVIGNPIKHSLSPIIHNFLFSYFGILAEYQKYLVLTPKELLETLRSLNGSNITLPYKQEAFLLCDEVRGIALEIEAVNTLTWEDGKLIGYNTDALGFYKCIEKKEFSNALILGAGGSAKAVALMLAKNGVSTTIYNRTPHRLDFFIQSGFKASTHIPNQSFDLVVNTTSVGLDGVTLPIEKSQLQQLLLQSSFAFDLIYPTAPLICNIDEFKSFLAKRPKTAFCALAQECYKESGDGLDMLVYQALLAFEIFAKKPDCFEELRALFYN